MALEVNVYCSLEELFAGCKKRQKVARRRVNADGKTVRTEDTVVAVDIKSGWKAGTRITYQGDGNEAVGMQTSDLVLTVREKPHPRFSRRDNDLVFVATVTLVEALCGTTLSIGTLDGRTLAIAVNQIVHPGFTQRVVGEGMPWARDPTKRGDLLIDFQIDFPKVLTPQQKQALAKILH